MNKAISIKQPWAYLICAGIKDVENKTWATKYRGRVYIHVSSQMAKHEFTWEQSSEFAKHEEIDIVYSAIIGHVNIVNYISKARNGKDSDSTWAKYDCFDWILRNPVLFDKPILNIKGKLSFWDCSEYLKGIEL